jgi:hypothetical protein
LRDVEWSDGVDALVDIFGRESEWLPVIIANSGSQRGDRIGLHASLTRLSIFVRVAFSQAHLLTTHSAHAQDLFKHRRAIALHKAFLLISLVPPPALILLTSCNECPQSGTTCGFSPGSLYKKLNDSTQIGHLTSSSSPELDAIVTWCAGISSKRAAAARLGLERDAWSVGAGGWRRDLPSGEDARSEVLGGAANGWLDLDERADRPEMAEWFELMLLAVRPRWWPLTGGCDCECWPRPDGRLEKDCFCCSRWLCAPYSCARWARVVGWCGSLGEARSKSSTESSSNTVEMSGPVTRYGLPPGSESDE